MTIKEIAALFEEYASLLELSGANSFKTRAIEQAVRILGDTPLTPSDFLESARKGQIKGIGKGILDHLEHIQSEGSFPELEELRGQFPDGVIEMLSIPGLGAKKVSLLYSERGIDSISALEKACTQGSVAELKGFGEKTQQKILDGIARLKKFSGKHRISTALREGSQIYESLKTSGLCSQLALAGSLRRRRALTIRRRGGTCLRPRRPCGRRWGRRSGCR